MENPKESSEGDWEMGIRDYGTLYRWRLGNYGWAALVIYAARYVLLEPHGWTAMRVDEEMSGAMPQRHENISQSNQNEIIFAEKSTTAAQP
jgi:hypothetical protein